MKRTNYAPRIHRKRLMKSLLMNIKNTLATHATAAAVETFSPPLAPEDAAAASSPLS